MMMCMVCLLFESFESMADRPSDIDYKIKDYRAINYFYGILEQALS